MSRTNGTDEALRLDRRSFVGMGLGALAALAALPTASALLAGCGGGEEGSKPSPAAPKASSGAAKPDAPQAAQESKVPTPAAQESKVPTPEAQESKVPTPTASPDAAGEQPLVTEVEAMRPTLQALQYVHESTKPDQQCSNCLFYTAGEGGRGKCQLFVQGVVAERGWCSSWSLKPSA